MVRIFWKVLSSRQVGGDLVLVRSAVHRDDFARSASWPSCSSSRPAAVLVTPDCRAFRFVHAESVFATFSSISRDHVAGTRHERLVCWECVSRCWDYDLPAYLKRTFSEPRKKQIKLKQQQKRCLHAKKEANEIRETNMCEPPGLKVRWRLGILPYDINRSQSST